MEPICYYCLKSLSIDEYYSVPYFGRKLVLPNRKHNCIPDENIVNRLNWEWSKMKLIKIPIEIICQIQF